MKEFKDTLLRKGVQIPYKYLSVPTNTDLNII